MMLPRLFHAMTLLASTACAASAGHSDLTAPAVTVREVKQGEQSMTFELAVSHTQALDERKKSVPAAVLVVWHRPTGLSWWTWFDEKDAQVLGNPADRFPRQLVKLGWSGIAVSGDAVVVAAVVGNFPKLFINESRARFAGVKEASGALTKDVAAGTDRSDHRFVDVDLINRIDRDFFIRAGAASSVGPKVDHVEPLRGGWLVVLAGPNGDWADITLDRDFKLVDVRRHR